jgi:hypothetical protein
MREFRYEAGNLLEEITMKRLAYAAVLFSMLIGSAHAQEPRNRETPLTDEERSREPDDRFTGPLIHPVLRFPAPTPAESARALDYLENHLKRRN